MIVYRCLTSKEIITMINNHNYQKALIKGENTFHYEPGISYKHFFIFADHAEYFRKENKISYPAVGQFVIPNNIIKENGFGFYGGVKTMRNDKLYGYYVPLPEIIISNVDFKNSYLYKIESELYSDFIQKSLDGDDNVRFNEPKENYFIYNGKGTHGITGYLDYSYADVYYEMIFQLAKENNMNMNKVAELLKNINLYDEIQTYFENNAKHFEKQTKKYLKTKPKTKVYSFKDCLKEYKNAVDKYARKL